jgi:hypothetical protein
MVVMLFFPFIWKIYSNIHTKIGRCCCCFSCCSSMTVLTFLTSTHLDKGICSPDNVVILRVIVGWKMYSLTWGLNKKGPDILHIYKVLHRQRWRCCYASSDHLNLHLGSFSVHCWKWTEMQRNNFFPCGALACIRVMASPYKALRLRSF